LTYSFFAFYALEYVEDKGNLAMPEDIFVNKELGVIEIKSYGDVTEEELYNVLGEVELIVKEHGIQKVLVDTSEEKQLPAIIKLDHFGKGIPKSLKVAILVSEKQPTVDKTKFVKNVASLKGTSITTFFSKEEAVEWLS
jgi:hypothetical protein